ncbi:hypothetical protein C5F47_06085 [Nitrosopumilus cobalaminigenes]|uniref:Uncharacterized protein n=1 Tax=Nitrosopumilus cobalaminigenes TaxID=1470066 RepID=A0A7D5M2S8_9ARCH|nr:hypothetical protein [Nitrosopumilus cobalaminigenes]QLH03148.1 hypothetical protein C5F47_06085 [Nitrosopumilus cobalaminigenes]
MKFERRDIVLIVGIFLVVLGITQYVPFHYSALIGVLLFFGVKLYVEKRRQSITNALPEGICVECGSKITDKKCPKCDYLEE